MPTCLRPARPTGRRHPEARPLRVAGVLACLAALAPAPAAAQWTAHTPMRRVQAVAAAGDSVFWAATTGGVFRYAPATGATRRVTVADGLHGTDARAVAVDRRGGVWVGYADGVLDRFDPATGAVATLRDIARAERFPQRAINRLVVLGDSVYAATDFGVVVFDPVRLEPRSTFSRFGAFAAAAAAYDVLRAPGPDGRTTLYVATAEGVAVGPLDGRNLQDPASWATEADGFAGRAVRSLAAFDGRLYAGLAADLAVREGGGVWRRLSVTAGAVLDLAAGARLVGADGAGLVLVDAGGAARRVTPGLDAVRAVEAAGGRLVAGSNTRGLVPLTPSGDAYTAGAVVVPPGPDAGLFSALSFAPDGSLWASGDDGAGTSGWFRRAPDGAWRSVTPQTTPGAPAGAITVAATADGGAWGGTNGNGAVRLAPDGAVAVYDQANASFRTSDRNDPAYPIVDGVALEGDAVVWATNKQATAPLHVRPADGTWRALALPRADGYEPSVYVGLNRVYVDGDGTKWITVQNEQDNRLGRGLLALSTGATPADPSDDALRFFAGAGANGQGLPSPLVLAVAEDRSGRLWAGTDAGPAYVLNTGVVPRDPTAAFVWPVNTEEQAYLLRGLRVNALAVDPAGGMWMGTNEGAWLVEERAGSFRVARRFTAANAPLPSDRVLAVGVEPRTGEVFFATDGGLVSWAGGPAAPVARPADLFVYPNPARADGDAALRVTIRGLIAETTVRILAPDGRLVARLDGRGGSLEWDGRDDAGRPAPSGVYLVVAVGANGEGAAYGKVAVLR